MKNALTKIGALCLGAIFIFGCEKESDMLDLKVSGESAAHVPAGCDVINFEQYQTGFITQLNSRDGVGPIAVYNKARNSSGTLVDQNRAMIFDSHNPTGDDADLYTGVGSTNGAMLGKVLIINELGVENEPNDNQWGGTMSLDFSSVGAVEIKTIDVVDIDTYEDESYIRVYGVGGALLKSVKLQALGNNSWQRAEINTTGVLRIEVILAGSNGFVGSGAIDEIVFCRQSTPAGCTRTQGYWKNHATGKKADPAWGNLANTTFFTSGQTYLEVLNTAPKGGDAYYILAHQYIAAKLNVAAGASMPTDVKTVYDLATAYFANPSASSASKNTLTQWADLLASYNEGNVGPGHCD